MKVNNGEVTLSGSVEERGAKRMAENIVEEVSGVREVHDQLRVQSRETVGSQSSGSANKTNTEQAKSATRK